MLQLLIACFLVIAPPQGGSIEIDVGGTRLTIPAPAGYRVVGPEMQPYFDFSAQFTAPTGIRLAEFLSAADAETAAKGQMPQQTRKFRVEGLKELAKTPVSLAEFAALKRGTVKQNGALIKAADTELPGLLERLKAKGAGEFALDPSLKFGDVFPMPPHEDSDRLLAYSMLVNMSTTDESGASTPVENACTVGILLVRAKVLFLCVDADRSDLAWTQTEGKRWCDQIIAANPPTSESTAIEARRSRPPKDLAYKLGFACGSGFVGLVMVVGAIFLVKRFMGR